MTDEDQDPATAGSIEQLTTDSINSDSITAANSIRGAMTQALNAGFTENEIAEALLSEGMKLLTHGDPVDEDETEQHIDFVVAASDMAEETEDPEEVAKLFLRASLAVIQRHQPNLPPEQWLARMSRRILG